MAETPSAAVTPRLIHPKERIEDALSRVDRMMWKKPGDKPVASIPARPDYDTDLILSDVAHELYGLREEIERLRSTVCSGACLLKLKFGEEDPHIRALLNAES